MHLKILHHSVLPGEEESKAINIHHSKQNNMNTTLTLENIDAIIQAMNKIKPIDRSEYFNNYYAEVIERRSDLLYIKAYLEAKEKEKQG